MTAVILTQLVNQLDLLEATLQRSRGDAVRDQYAPEFRDEVAQMFREQGAALLRRLGVAHDEHAGVQREAAADPSWWTSPEVLDYWDEVETGLRPGHITTFRNQTGGPFGEGVRRGQADVATNFALQHATAEAWLESNAALKVTGINRTTRVGLNAFLTNARKQGMSYDKTARTLAKRFSDMGARRPQAHIRDRATLIAVNETGWAYENGSFMHMQNVQKHGILVQKSLLSVGDRSTCPECEDIEMVGWVSLESDLVPLAPIHPACRCTMLYQQSEGKARRTTGSQADAAVPTPMAPLAKDVSRMPYEYDSYSAAADRSYWQMKWNKHATELRDKHQGLEVGPRPDVIKRAGSGKFEIGIVNDYETIRDTAEAWQATMEGMKQVRWWADDIVEKGRFIPDNAGHRGTAGLLQMIDDATPTNYKTYRGIFLEDDTIQTAMAKFKTGSKHDWHLTSFSDSYDIADTFIDMGSGSMGLRKGGVEVVIELQSGAKGIYPGALGRQSRMLNMKEFLTGGRFKVTGTHTERGGQRLRVVVEQEGTFKLPTSVKPVPKAAVQAADDTPAWIREFVENELFEAPDFGNSRAKGLGWSSNEEMVEKLAQYRQATKAKYGANAGYDAFVDTMSKWQYSEGVAPVRASVDRIMAGTATKADDGARSMLQAIDAADPEFRTVYRALNGVDASDFQIGKTFDAKMASWTDDLEVAKAYGDDVVLNMTEESKGIYVGAHGENASFIAQREFVTNGRFEVVNVEILDGVAHVEVRQLSTLKPPASAPPPKAAPKPKGPEAPPRPPHVPERATWHAKSGRWFDEEFGQFFNHPTQAPVQVAPTFKTKADHVRHLLQTTDKSVSQIAKETGAAYSQVRSLALKTPRGVVKAAKPVPPPKPVFATKADHVRYLLNTTDESIAAIAKETGANYSQVRAIAKRLGKGAAAKPKPVAAPRAAAPAKPKAKPRKPKPQAKAEFKAPRADLDYERRIFEPIAQVESGAVGSHGRLSTLRPKEFVPAKSHTEVRRRLKASKLFTSVPPTNKYPLEAMNDILAQAELIERRGVSKVRVKLKFKNEAGTNGWYHNSTKYGNGLQRRAAQEGADGIINISPEGRWGYGTSRNAGETFMHEYGHAVSHYRATYTDVLDAAGKEVAGVVSKRELMREQLFNAWDETLREVKGGAPHTFSDTAKHIGMEVSAYAKKSASMLLEDSVKAYDELFAEHFAVIMRPGYVKGELPKRVEDIMLDAIKAGV